LETFKTMNTGGRHQKSPREGAGKCRQGAELLDLRRNVWSVPSIHTCLLAGTPGRPAQRGCRSPPLPHLIRG